ncbi:ABC transporter permease [Paenibacillus pinihumi]|uniref:ABC transporter permease n=1 Tax=Paenibacillus pinihumi TaxID=669462 RepID=UPI000428BA78|nr:ABC transporter permease [Paenibacillus pinihumi]
MFLALREMRHAKARYMLILVIMLLVSFLVLFVTGLAKGLANANISAVENMPAGYFAVQEDAGHIFRRSMLGEQELKVARSVAGEEGATPLSLQMSTITADAGAAGDKGLKADVTFFAVDMNGLLAPSGVKGERITNETKGQVIADEKLERLGVKIGSFITDQSTGKSFQIAGFVKNSSFSHTPVVYMNPQDWLEFRQGTAGGQGAAASFNVIALHITAEQAAELSGKLNHAEVITRQQAVSSIPGYSEEQGSLMMMIVFLFVIAAFVLAVFFYVITIQKTSQFGILKAMGTKMSYLGWSVVGQVMILSAGSLAVSLLLVLGMNMALPASMPFRLEPLTIVGTSLLFIGMSLLGSLVSVIRVAKVDALEAIGRANA